MKPFYVVRNFTLQEYDILTPPHTLWSVFIDPFDLWTVYTRFINQYSSFFGACSCINHWLELVNVYGVLLFPLVLVFFKDRKNENLLIFNYVFIIKSRVKKQSAYYYCEYNGIFFSSKHLAHFLGRIIWWNGRVRPVFILSKNHTKCTQNPFLLYALWWA